MQSEQPLPAESLEQQHKGTRVQASAGDSSQALLPQGIGTGSSWECDGSTGTGFSWARPGSCQLSQLGDKGHCSGVTVPQPSHGKVAPPREEPLQLWKGFSDCTGSMPAVAGLGRAQQEGLVCLEQRWSLNLTPLGTTNCSRNHPPVSSWIYGSCWSGSIWKQPTLR